MNTLYLQYFIAVVDSGSINKAAKKYYINHSSINYAINALEKDINKPLIIKTKQGVQITKVGERVYTDAKKILAIIDAWSTIEDNKKIIAKIETVPCIYNTFLTNIVLNLSKLYPYLRIISSEIVNTIPLLKYHEEIPSLFISGVYDNELLEEQQLCQKNELNIIPLFQSKMVFYCNRTMYSSEKKEVTIEEIKNTRIYTNSSPDVELNAFWPLFCPEKVVFLSTQQQIFQAIDRHKGGTILPEFLKSFEIISNTKNITSYPIRDYNKYFHIRLYYNEKELGKSDNIVLEYLKSFPYCNRPGANKDTLIVF